MTVDFPDTFVHAPNSQYDADSAPNQNFNCGPTTVTNVVKFHTGHDFPINATRRLATISNGVGTNLAQRKIMFEGRGVPASIQHLSYADMKRRLDDTRTIELAVLMSKIPQRIRVRPFPGSHSVEALCGGVVNGVSGVYINNPDFHADRDELSRYFIPDEYLKAAYDALGSWCLVPDKPRVVPTRTSYVRKMKTTAAVYLRSGPGRAYSGTIVPAGTAFTSIQLETAGGSYDAAGKTRRDWVSLSRGGKLVWVARGYTKEI